MSGMKNNDRPEAAKRLEMARVKRGFATAKDAARFFGWVYETYIQHEQGIRGIGRQSRKYADAFRVGEGWLLTGEGEGPGSDGPIRSIPILAWVSAGDLSRDDIQQDVVGEIAVAGLDAKGRWIALRVEGDSMDRISPPGSIILVNTSDRQLVPNACYIIANGEGEATYKRFRANPRRFEPVSTNGEHEPIFFENPPLVVGRVRRTILDM
jgi:phage repressor protein C with HTH and peptisase S24 domain